MDVSPILNAEHMIDAIMTFVSAEFSGIRILPGAVGADRAARVVAGAEGIDAIESVWRALAASADDHAVFQCFGFARAAARYHERRGERVVTALVERAGKAECILPIAIARRGGVRVGAFLGDPVAQYGDALVGREAAPRAAALALAALASKGGVDVLQFRRVRSDAALMPALAAFARPAGPTLEAPRADLLAAPTVDALLLAIGGAKQRRERARSRRRLAELGPLGFEALRGRAALGALREAFALKGAWLARQGLVSTVIEDLDALGALEAAACDPVEGEALVVLVASVGGAPAAYEVGFVRGARFHAYLGAVSDAFAGASPGKVLMEDAFGWCRAEGIDTYDLLPPGDGYKRQWSNGATDVQDYVAPVSLVGRLYAGPWLRTARPALRAAFGRLPPALRRRLGRAALQAGAR